MMQKMIKLCRCWLAMCLALVGLAGMQPAAAQPGGDQGQYQVLQALYGTAERHVDVTQRLRELARQDRTVTVGNDVLGADPHPGQRKTLRIYARGIDGQQRSFDYLEGSQLDGTRFTAWRSGNWGQGGWNGGWSGVPGPQPVSPARPGDSGQYMVLQASYGTDERSVDVTPRVRELMRTDRSFQVGNDVLGGDPHPRQAKSLRINARGPDGVTRSFEFREGALVDGAQFVGSVGAVPAPAPAVGSGPGPGYAQADEGQYLILQASYGTAERNVDVTQRLKELARQDRTIRVSNEVLGTDPHHGQTKTLRIFARGREGQQRSFEYTEGGTVDGRLFTGWSGGRWGQGGWFGGWGENRHPGSNRIGYGANSGSQLAVISATYGDGERQQDITYRLRSFVQADRLNVRVDNDTTGTDPAPRVVKMLWVTYSMAGGPEQRRQVREGDWLSLP